MADGIVLFGSRQQQATLEEIHLRGAGTVRPGVSPIHLLNSCLVVTAACGGSDLTFERRHPAYNTLREVLAATSGRPGVEPQPPAKKVRRFSLRPIRPLAHRGRVAFRILNLVSLAQGKLTVDGLARRIPDTWFYMIRPAARQLVDDGVLVVNEDGRLSFASGVPPAYVRLIAEIAAHLGLDEIPAAFDKVADKRPTAFMQAADGAPRLFGADARLRNLMALAKYGPLDYRDLRRITGAGHLKREGQDDAPTGRGAVALQWKASNFTSYALDPDYPVYEPLLRLLLKLEETYPLPPVEPMHPRPELPPRRPWEGARTELFGDIIPTTILTSIGVHGWTYESLCDEILANDRFNIKKSMQRLEREGVLQGDRPRRPGADVRVVTISDTFPAKTELEELLRAYVEAWPATATAVRRGFEKIAAKAPRAKAHLKKRGLWPY